MLFIVFIIVMLFCVAHRQKLQTKLSRKNRSHDKTTQSVINKRVRVYCVVNFQIARLSALPGLCVRRWCCRDV